MKFLFNFFLWLTAPFVFKFLVKDEWEFMPKDSFLRYYQDYTYGINGDPMWVNPDLSDHPPTKEAARTWLWRTRWSRRNANVWEHEHGCNNYNLADIKIEGDIWIRNRPVPAKSGFMKVVVTDKQGKKYTCKYTIKQWGNTGRCWRFYRGYKLQDVAQFYDKYKTLDPAVMKEHGIDEISPQVFAPNPLMGFDK